MADAFQPAFGRLEAPDPEDKKFPMAMALPEAPPELPPYQHWPVPRVFNQNLARPVSSCVGQSWRGGLEASPCRVKPGSGPDALTIYREAQRTDEFDGEEPLMQGTSVRAGAKVLQALGYLASYLWAWEAETARRFVLLQGPIVIGVRWYAGMMEPRAGKPLRVSGPLLGGHAVLVCGYSESNRSFRIQNSWGRDWGSENGKAWLRYEDLDRLLREGGEACCASEQAAP